ncbi:SpoIIE family protein phosphatase/ATP-binding protein [Streptomyces sp. NRRL F-5123]|uniref:SpoIIE family protein phosphatase/ATP-binding protein n=1 Tax=Streptomyces sp. NRRL F-5123 TaxID=1463856 RepID=UPI00099D597A|nr:SpoIIE family protein phosphatase/ATP-binding protein [Streptomyces sp. NRRL F-5123]
MHFSRRDPPGDRRAEGPPRGRWWRSPGSLLGARSVVGQMFVLQMAIILLMAVVAVVLLVATVERAATRSAADRSRAVADAIAHSPGITAALQSHDPTAVLQPDAEAIRRGAGLDFVEIVDKRGIRYTHADRRLIGKRITYSKDLDALRSGRAITGRNVPASHTTMRTFMPIRDSDGAVIGGVAVGVRVAGIGTEATRQLPPLLGVTAAGVVAGAVGAALVGRSLLRQTYGLGPAEITRMYRHHDAVLHAAREGIVIVDADHRILLVNEEARRLLDLPPQVQGRLVDELALERPLSDLLASGRAAADEVHLAGGRVLTVNQRPLGEYGAASGSVATMRDSTELRELSGRAEAARERLALLYQAGVGIGTTLDVTRTAEELAEAAVPRFTDYMTIDLAEPVLQGDEPTGRERVLRRVVVVGVQDDAPFAAAGERVSFALSASRAEDFAAGKGAIDPDLRVVPGHVPGYAPGFASPEGRRDTERARRVVEHGVRSLVTVPMRARGVVLGVAGFWRTGSREPFERGDLELAEELAGRTAVAVDNARRYTREHAMAVTLQRSLLPGSLSAPGALEIAHRYLPTEAGGVGGDWFDAIALPGARVALVVGDVVGHGLHAAATMGRLRTAVHNLSALDLAPDELMAHLDELVSRMDGDDDTDRPVTGATCLYAIYDPASGRAVMTRAGHPGPVLVRPDGSVSTPEVPVSPPLGLGGAEPFETAELQLAEGSLLVLHTDGLVERRGHDIDFGLGLLRDALAGHPGRGPEETCRAVMDVLLPTRPADDVALLVARTRLLPRDRIVEWELPLDAAAVAPVRAGCARQLQDWGLSDLGYTTELILSELATNAIRYAAPPITVRLLYDDRALICEVADGSSTSPHLRRAATTDESGRGLFLVARLARRWGTRYTRRGKVIWTEQALDAAPPPPSADTTDTLLDQWGDDRD